MKTSNAVGLSMLIGLALGALAIQGLHAQAKPPTYVVIDIANLTDPDGFKAVPTSPGANPARLTALGGRYVIRTETMTVIDGTPPKRFVVLAFDNREKAQAWVDAPDVKETNAIRAKTRIRVRLSSRVRQTRPVKSCALQPHRSCLAVRGTEHAQPVMALWTRRSKRPTKLSC
jgi:uncharacterized protein (DUF1330 family)